MVLFCSLLVCWLRFLSTIGLRFGTFRLGIFVALLSFAEVTGRSLFISGSSSINHISLYADVFLLFIGLLPLVAILKEGIVFVRDRCSSFRICAKIASTGSLKLFFMTQIAIGFIWGLMYVLGAFPGVYGYDAIYQIRDFAQGSLTDHQPVIHTLMLGFSVFTLGHKTLHSDALGLAIYCVLQIYLMSFLLSWAITKLVSLGFVKSAIFLFLVLLLFPYNYLLACSTTKDSIFACSFILSVVYAIEFHMCLRSGGNLSWAWGLQFAFVIFFGCLFRNNAIYAYTLYLLFTIVVCRKQRKRICLAALLVLVGWMLYTHPIYEALGVQREGHASMLSVPAQQLARAATTNRRDLSAGDLQEIAAYYPTWQQYRLGIADDVKKSLNEQLFASDPIAFFRLWLKVGLKAPLSYIDAFLVLSLGNWYPDMQYPVPDGYHPYLEYGRTYDLNGSSWVWNTEDYYEAGNGDSNLVYVWLNPPSALVARYFSWVAAGGLLEIPVLSLFANPAIPVWVLFAFILFTRRDGQSRFLIGPVFLCLMYWITLMAGPTVLFRYSYCLLLAVPVLLGVWLDSGATARG